MSILQNTEGIVIQPNPHQTRVGRPYRHQPDLTMPLTPVQKPWPAVDEADRTFARMVQMGEALLTPEGRSLFSPTRPSCGWCNEVAVFATFAQDELVCACDKHRRELLVVMAEADDGVTRKQPLRRTGRARKAVADAAG
jgi:hypothetical protein